MLFFIINIEDGNSPNYLVFPNPTSGVLNIENTEASLNQSNSTYKLYDFNGNPVLTGTFDSWATLDLSALLDGHYILKITTSGTTKTRHIIVE